MALDVFKLRDQVVDEYQAYVKSFIQVLDERINDFVNQRLEEGELWPDAVLQLNPAFKMDLTLGELADQGILAPQTAQFFGPDLRLFQHQRDAIDIGLRGESFVVTTGTGSGKSLTYLIPIFDAIIKNQPEQHTVRAMLIYPMNALINSQVKALEDFKRENFPDCPVRFASYTGQDSQEAKDKILEDPPHILLTNYVMADYILVRPHERSMLAKATRELNTLVMDELHFYRGRQGADVAMLVRRLQETAEHDLQGIATSATLITGESREERKEAVAELASRFFGLNIPPTNVVDETLRRIATVPIPKTNEQLTAAIKDPSPVPTLESVRQHPLAAWAEEAFGVEENQDGNLVRRSPQTFRGAAQILATESGLPQKTARTNFAQSWKLGTRPCSTTITQRSPSGSTNGYPRETPCPPHWTTQTEGNSGWTGSIRPSRVTCCFPWISAGNAGRNTTWSPGWNTREGNASYPALLLRAPRTSAWREKMDSSQ